MEIHDEYQRAFVFIGSAYLAQGDPNTALDWYQRGQALERAVRSYDALIVRALAPLGRRDEAEEILARLEEESRQHYVRQDILAMGYAALGDLDRAFACLDRALEERSGGLIVLAARFRQAVDRRACKGDAEPMVEE